MNKKERASKHLKKKKKRTQRPIHFSLKRYSVSTDLGDRVARGSPLKARMYYIVQFTQNDRTTLVGYFVVYRDCADAEVHRVRTSSVTQLLGRTYSQSAGKCEARGSTTLSEWL